MQPLISLIVPVYNSDTFLPACLENLLNQTYKNTEIILVDDGSTDNSAKICDDYASKNENILVLHKENGGVSSSREVGLKRASGEYVVFVDGDDYLANNAIELLYIRALKEKSDVVMGQYVKVYDDGKIEKIKNLAREDLRLTKNEALSMLGSSNDLYCSFCGKLFKKQILLNLEFKKLLCSEDECMWPLILDRCQTVCVISDTIYYYVQNSGSTVHNKTDNHFFDSVRSAISVAKFFLDKGMDYNAAVYYNSAIYRAAEMNDAKIALNLFFENFTSIQRKRLIKKDVSVILRWISFKVPLFYKILRKFKNKT